MITIDASTLNPAQLKAVQATEPQVLVSGGFGSGKTTGLSIKFLQMLSDNPGIPGLILSSSWSTLWATTMRRVFATLKLCGIPYRLRDRQGECYLDFGDGVPVFLRSAKKPDTFDGLDVGYVLGDELRHWAHMSYNVALGRRRIPCPRSQFAGYSTPAMGWLDEEFNTGKAGRKLIIAPTKENERNLAPGFIDNLRLSYSKRLQKAVIDGQFTVLEGAVFEEFDPSPGGPWVVDYNAAAHKDRRTYLAVDPGYRRSAWLFIHKVGELDWVCFDEMMLDDCSDMTAVERVNAKGYGIDEIWTDPAADSTQSVDANKTMQVLGMIKTRTPKPKRTIVNPWRSIAYGVDKMRVMLGGGGLPVRLRFASSLLEKERGKARGIVKDLSVYRYPEVKDGRPVTDIPVKDGISDHSCDALRYWTVGMVLTTGMRNLDPVLAKEARPGWRVAS